MAKIITADNFTGQKILLSGRGYHSTLNSQVQLYLDNQIGNTTGTSNNYLYPYTPILLPFDATIEKIIVKNIPYASYTSGPSANGTAQIHLGQYDSIYAPKDYSSSATSFTAASYVSLEWEPNISYTAGEHFRVFFNSDVYWRYILCSVLLKIDL
jgi:hypothetical protein